MSSTQHPVYERILELAERRSSIPPKPMIEAREQWQQGFIETLSEDDLIDDDDPTLPGIDGEIMAQLLKACR